MVGSKLTGLANGFAGASIGGGGGGGGRVGGISSPGITSLELPMSCSAPTVLSFVAGISASFWLESRAWSFCTEVSTASKLWLGTAIFKPRSERGWLAGLKGSEL